METEYELVEKALSLDSERKFDEAYELWMLLAEEYNNTTAYFFLGSYYQHGILPVDYKKAKEYYFLGAKLGDADCICNLGYCFEFGLGLKKSKKKAFDYYKKAAKLGNESAIYNLANCYIRGDGVEKNIDLGIKYYEEISYDFPLAAFRLGSIYADGEIVPMDIKMAIKYYKRGAALNNRDCLYNLACLIENKEESFTYMEKAAMLGHSNAMSDLGYYYQTGYGVEQDEFEGYEWFCKAADLLDPLGLINKAVCLREGIGVVKDEKESFNIFKMCADFGSDDGRYNLAVAYETGRGVKKSISKALYYYNLVDSVESDVRKAKIYRSKRNYDKALSFFMHRSDESNEAAYYLAYMLKNGEGTEVNLEEAIYYFKKLINNKEYKAYVGLIECYLALGEDDEAIKCLNEGIGNKNVDCIIAKYRLDRMNNEENYIDILLKNYDLDDSIKLEVAKEYYYNNKLDDCKKIFEELRKNKVSKASYYLSLMEDDLDKKKELLLEANEYILLSLLSLDNIKKALSYAKKAILDEQYLGYVLYICLLYRSTNDSDIKILKNINTNNLYEIIENDYDELSLFVKGILKYYGITVKENLIEAKSLIKMALRKSEKLNEIVSKNKHLYKFSLTRKNK